MPETQYRFMEARIRDLEEERDQYRIQRNTAVASLRKVLRLVAEELNMLAQEERDDT